MPFIQRGTMIQFGGIATMPFALLVLAESLNPLSLPRG
jgi:hypothetical protein